MNQSVLGLFISIPVSLLMLSYLSVANQRATGLQLYNNLYNCIDTLNTLWIRTSHIKAVPDTFAIGCISISNTDHIILCTNVWLHYSQGRYYSEWSRDKVILQYIKSKYHVRIKSDRPGTMTPYDTIRWVYDSVMNHVMYVIYVMQLVFNSYKLTVCSMIRLW